MASKKRGVPGINSSSTADIALYVAYFLPDNNINGY